MDNAPFPLMRHFLVWSIVTTVLVALLLAFASAGEMEQDLLAKDRRYAQLLASIIHVQIDEHFIPFLEERKVEFSPTDPDQVRLMDKIVRINTEGLGVLRVNFFDDQGEIVFSTEPPRIGARQPTNPVLRRAIDGQAATKLVATAEESHEPRGSSPPFLESYIPVRFDLGSHRVRVFEIYQEGEDNLATVRSSKRRLAFAAIGAMILLFGGNLYIVRRGAASIDEERHLAAGYLAEARDLNDKLAALTEDLEKKVDRAAQELVAADRLAAVGTLAAGVAHEVNTPLASISTCAEGLLRRSRSLDDRDRQYLATIRDEAFRCKRITRQLLDFARPGSHESARDVDLRELVARAFRLLEFEVDAKRVTFRIEGSPLAVRGSADELEQVVLNLAKNALDAVESGGEIVVQVRATSGGRALLVIEDNGPGVREDQLGHLLDPFYTTKAPGSGTGLGLSVSYGIVKRHGGEMRLENRAEGGLRATVALPRASMVVIDDGDYS